MHSQEIKYGKLRNNSEMGGDFVISYEPFYKTLYQNGITEYRLIYKEGFSPNTLYRMKKGEAISTKTLDAMCYTLDCKVQDIQNL